MVQITKNITLVVLMASSQLALAGNAKDCLLQGTVVHKEVAGQEKTMVQIHSVSKYEENSTCKVREGQKMEFKLPHDSRVNAAPSGSEVKYRYKTDESGGEKSEVIMVGA